MWPSLRSMVRDPRPIVQAPRQAVGEQRPTDVPGSPLMHPIAPRSEDCAACDVLLR